MLRQVARFGTGPLIGEILERMNATVAGDPSAPKFVLLSGHDNGPVLNFLAAFGAGDDKWPPFGALIALELYEISGKKHAVRLVYNGQVLTARITGCEGQDLCNWDVFSKTATSLVPNASECAITASPPSAIDVAVEEAKRPLILTISVLSIVLVGLVLFVLVAGWNRQRPSVPLQLQQPLLTANDRWPRHWVDT
jgi:hypothetical protein